MSELTDPLGDRMKGYEHASRTFVPPKSWVIVRVDGRAFHTWTRGMQRPYDQSMVEAMGALSQRLSEEISGSVLSYAQSLSNQSGRVR